MPVVGVDLASQPKNSSLCVMELGPRPRVAELVSRVDERGRPKVIERGPGDGTVPRTSALMDERVGGAWERGVRTPIEWRHTLFLFSDHLGLTKDPVFTDNVLYWLLEAPR